MGCDGALIGFAATGTAEMVAMQRAVEEGRYAEGKAIWVHAITRENAEGFADDEMNRRVAWMDGAKESGTEESGVGA